MAWSETVFCPSTVQMPREYINHPFCRKVCLQDPPGLVSTCHGPDVEHAQMKILLEEEALHDISIAFRHVRTPSTFSAHSLDARIE